MSGGVKPELSDMMESSRLEGWEVIASGHTLRVRQLNSGCCRHTHGEATLCDKETCVSHTCICFLGRP